MAVRDDHRASKGDNGIEAFEGPDFLAGDDMLVLKGSKDGVAIVIDESVPFHQLIPELKEKLAEAESFFRGGTVKLDMGNRRLSSDEIEAVKEIAGQFGVELDLGELDASRPMWTGIIGDFDDDTSHVGRRAREEVPADGRSSATTATPSVAAGWVGDGHTGSSEEGLYGLGRTDVISDATLLLRRTIRSGQRIEFDGNVVVLGDVNAGAVVTCTGDIIVLGALRGVAHAGAVGNEDAVVVAFRLEPTQLRIAHYISRSPDEPVPGLGQPEEARVKDGMIQIQAYEP